MQIDDALLSKLERLSMIRIDDKKRTQTQEQLTEIVGFVENLSAIEVPQDCFSEELKTPLREDIPKDSQIAKDVLSHAPKAQDNFFIVPKIIE
ncbi:MULTISPECIES: Asp-tRNA(Asn)/Glu-tRNA(Gln) amidotransferase subunit GatC [Helicobacter]|uniref:Aspartyl/glutamyl-tRNA(Asn/Gln) amidotransferase subunit C n=1 Tax=Helicobacter typhlonius TaxID=76936 RepID=A0A099UCT4_9HELI|nr:MULTISPECIES: Asp-tRNA(Asn)/Glu-tRNA(Gln) amidotransferase subunit GatC [Helicobacter]TLD78164.1 Asp-tRNA(Asn)/Glu-tRNA(Gln) amidotransferase subunit GatC [Helicobacter typhlonius]TLD85935.1 Asp-tRNA(Asn)/Glu-tRNA(Gln) amidotransferase subunit GatC [Helicobacter sp. MIT 03-1616]CUU39025.1 Aspartyl-tRNA(Asn) amidotransferase subunit C @ Glutamyl-tRNA(Gln) amidotransferase subunit C [Helicobacter typhlonius]